MSIDFLNGLTESIAPEGGYVAIITNQGVLTANSFGEELGGHNMQEDAAWASISETMENGEITTLYLDSEQLKENAFNVFAPMILEDIDETWTVQIVSA